MDSLLVCLNYVINIAVGIVSESGFSQELCNRLLKSMLELFLEV